MFGRVLKTGLNDELDKLVNSKKTVENQIYEKLITMKILEKCQKDVCVDVFCSIIH